MDGMTGMNRKKTVSEWVGFFLLLVFLLLVSAACLAGQGLFILFAGDDLLHYGNGIELGGPGNALIFLLCLLVPHLLRQFSIFDGQGSRLGAACAGLHILLGLAGSVLPFCFFAEMVGKGIQTQPGVPDMVGLIYSALYLTSAVLLPVADAICWVRRFMSFRAGKGGIRA